jgi:hypothetical protein
MHVVFADGRDGDQVTDVRLVSGDRVRGTMSELVMEGFVIGKRRTGTYFGTTGTPHGTLGLRTIIRALHRHTGYLGWVEISEIDWHGRVLRLRVNELTQLAPC